MFGSFEALKRRHYRSLVRFSLYQSVYSRTASGSEPVSSPGIVETRLQFFAKHFDIGR
jgi:hypothetical protein